jgi:hypothetical protein
MLISENPVRLENNEVDTTIIEQKKTFAEQSVQNLTAYALEVTSGEPSTINNKTQYKILQMLDIVKNIVAKNRPEISNKTPLVVEVLKFMKSQPSLIDNQSNDPVIQELQNIASLHNNYNNPSFEKSFDQSKVKTFTYEKIEEDRLLYNEKVGLSNHSNTITDDQSKAKQSPKEKLKGWLQNIRNFFGV